MDSLKDFYEVIDVLKDDQNGKVSVVYDKVGQQFCVAKRRDLKSAELYYNLQKLKNKYVPKIYRLIEINETLLIIEEYIAGRTLAEILNYENHFDESTAADILLQICNALKILHEKNIIHRDIKPSNIMLTNDGEIKLIDFSIARILKIDNKNDTENLGTRGYAPPEQYGFAPTDARSDIYSLGMTLQRLLGENYRGYLQKIIKRCTKLDPMQRYLDIDSLINDLEHRRWRKKLSQLKNQPKNNFQSTIDDQDVYDKLSELIKLTEEIDALEEDYNAVKSDDKIQAQCIMKGAERLAKEFENIADSLNDADFEEIAKAVIEYPVENLFDDHDDKDK